MQTYGMVSKMIDLLSKSCYNVGFKLKQRLFSLEESSLALVVAHQRKACLLAIMSSSLR